MKSAILMLGVMSSLALTVNVRAQEEPQSIGALQEVVVTAQKRTERLQDVPLSVTAISSDTLKDSGVTSLLDLGQVVPSLSVGNAVGFSFTYLRGIGSTGIGPGIELPVSFYIDGVYYASTVSATFYEFANIDHIEVLKGPQGTLFGRNATGGLIQILTKDPTQDFHMSADLTYGNYETVKGSAFISGGVAEHLAADFSIQSGTQGQGWGRNLYTGSDVFKNNDNVTARSKWVYTPADGTKVTFIGDYSQADNSMNGQKLAPGSVPSPTYGAGPQPAQGPWDMYADADPHFRNSNEGASLKVEQSLDWFNVSNLAAYRNSRTALYWDVDFTPVPHLTGDLRDLESQVSDELTFSSKGGGKFNWQTGLFVFHSDGSYDPAGVHSGDGLFGPFVYVAPYAKQITQSEAAFAQGTYEVFTATDLTLGVRYTSEYREAYGHQDGFTADSTTPVSLTTTPRETLNFNKPTYRAALDHHFTADTLGYVSFNTGFKSGGFNTQFVSQPAFLPESVKAYEVGIKTDLLERRVRLNAAAFDYDYKNIQIQKVGIANTGIINGASARIYGMDTDFEAIVTDSFTITGSAAYLHAKFSDFTNAPFGSVGGGIPTFPGDASGNDIPKSPRFTANLTGDYSIGLPGGSGVHLLATYEYNSGFALEPDNIFRQKAFSRVNLAAKWESMDQRYYVRLWADNVTNKAIISYSTSLADGTRDVTYEAPRLYGVTVGYKFN